MYTKKIGAWVCAVILVVSILSGCTGNAANTDEPASSPSNGNTATASQNEGANQISEEKITITALAAPFPEVKLFDFDYDKNHFTKWLEDNTNIHINWVTAASVGDITQKLSLMLSSGEIPDIMFLNNFSPSVQKQYGDQGLLLPLNDYIDKYGVWTKKMFEEMPETKAAVTLDEGEIYALPAYAEDPHLSSFYKMWIYKPWLDKLGLKVPETTEQLYEVLKAFKDKDPNDNGKNDEIPLLGNTAWLSWDPTTFLMNAFVYYDSEKKMIMNNGKIEPVFTKPEFKEGLKYMQRLVREGLLSAESFAMDFNQFKQAVENPNFPLVGAMPSHAPFVAADTRHSDYVAIAPLKGPQGVQYANYHYTTNNMGVVISSQTKHPVEVFKLLDFLYSEEATIRMTIGREGHEWDYAKEGDGPGGNGQQAKYKKLATESAYNQNEGEKNVNWYMIGNYYNPKSLQDSFVAQESEQDNLMKVLEKATTELYAPYQPDKAILLPQTIVLSEEESAEITDIEITITDYVTETMSQFILGRDDIDQAWDGYLKELDKMGLAKLIATYQAVIDRKDSH